jgi:hypothetical protein
LPPGFGVPLVGAGFFTGFERVRGFFVVFARAGFAVGLLVATIPLLELTGSLNHRP